jgi:nonribosomal peptide synthetase protein VioO
VVGAPTVDALSPPGDAVDGFLAAARAHPDRPAIVHHGQTVSYAELRGRVREVAGRLGPRPGVVGVTATHSPETVTALLGVWAAGGTYCPVDPAFPTRRRQAMLADAGCRILLDPGSPEGTPVEVRRLHLAGADHSDLAYVLFTSGSTGESRPVMTPRRAIGVATRSLRGLFGITGTDRVLQFASLNWDTCLEEILPTLTSGACLVLHRDAHSGSFPRLLRMVDSERVTVLDLPTAYWHELVHYLEETGAPLPGCVRLVVIGGEAASPHRLAGWQALRTGHARLLNTYGCTETTLVTHAVDLHGPGVTVGRWSPTSPVPIGRPLPHVAEHVTGEGELLVGGPSLAAGYRGLPAATAERFVAVGGRRFFRTGDRVRRMPDGTLRIEGRLDHELKIRGVRVNPAEVEAHIAGHPEVGAVAVTGVGVADHTVLAAYVVPRAPVGGAERPADGAGPADAAGIAAAVLDYLRERVPAHLVPGRVHVVSDLLYTPTGKVDRRRLAQAVGGEEIPR